MRDPKRIDEICELIRQGWHSVPDWRFLQLINNLIRYINQGDGFYVEDDELEKKLKEYFDYEGD